MAVPISALVTPLSAAASLVVVPVCWAAHCRQEASSAWKCSSGLALPGNTTTFGPVGTLTQAVVARAATSTRQVVLPITCRGSVRGY